MQHALIQKMQERIASGLIRKSVTTCSRWAELYRVMGGEHPGPWLFDRYPWARAMHDCEAETMVGQKAAQMGFTEVALNKTFYKIDVEGVSCLYVLPSKNPAASNFSTSRFDPALEMSPHLRNIFSDVKNVMHKRAGSASLFIRGSRSKTDLKSDPVGFMVFDEVEEMVQANIPLAFERLSGHEKKQKYLLSTPSVDGHGINVYFAQSTQNVFFFRCPHCGRMINLEFPRNLVVTSDNPLDRKIEDSHLKCHLCNGVLEHKDKVEMFKNSEWVPQYPDMAAVGFHINQLYSTTVVPAEIARFYLLSLSEPAYEQELYNSKLGLPHTVEGARVMIEDVESCMGEHRMSEGAKFSRFVTMGVDVGKWLHVEIAEWHSTNAKTADINLRAEPRILKILKVSQFEELDRLMYAYGINMCVIDANPESRKALEFARRFPGHVRVCYYGNAIRGKDIKIGVDLDLSVSVDRTTWLDLSLGRFHSRKISLPVDTPHEYKQHMTALIRVYRLDRDENPVSGYVKEHNKADHYAHARNYCEIALAVGAGVGVTENVN